MKIEKIKAKSVSYGPMRALSEIEYQVIHYTGNNGDTAQGNGKYFRDSNTRAAGAHFFISQNGDVVESIPMELTAWSVGGDHRSGKPGEAKYYKKCTNANSISIELCDNLKHDPSKAQKEAVGELIEYIRKHCPNARKVIRHFDVTGKYCPARMMDSKKWNAFKLAVGV
jgi:N-acetylmuramoyl-L-alanine amidase CwlA